MAPLGVFDYCLIPCRAIDYCRGPELYAAMELELVIGDGGSIVRDNEVGRQAGVLSDSEESELDTEIIDAPDFCNVSFKTIAT